ncbi:MAG: hypothetical protein SWH78_04290 [Thermodesulfobacteriota bacterium]|nr:hypothetical protein [Thermodesulfobacteriota bacterium]
MIEQEDKERDKALEQTLGRVDYGFAGWKLKKRDGVRKLKAGNLDEKALKTIWSWSLAGEDKKDIKERYDFEQRILGNATKQSMKQVAEKIKALMVGRNKMSKDEERLLTEKIVTAKKTKSPYKLKDSNGGVIELPAIELEWKQEKKKTVRRKKKTRR